METIIRKVKSDLVKESLSDEPYLSWIQRQAERISEFANVIREIEDDQKRKIISPIQVNECAAKFVEFYTKNTAFSAIYQELKSHWESQAKDLYDLIYLDIKREVTDYTSDRGSKYKKKDATQAEIAMEMKTHERYKEYVELSNKANELLKKAELQDSYLKCLGKLDMILSLLQKAMTIELKYLHLE